MHTNLIVYINQKSSAVTMPDSNLLEDKRMCPRNIEMHNNLTPIKLEIKNFTKLKGKSKSSQFIKNFS